MSPGVRCVNRCDGHRGRSEDRAREHDDVTPRASRAAQIDAQQHRSREQCGDPDRVVRWGHAYMERRAVGLIRRPHRSARRRGWWRRPPLVAGAVGALAATVDAVVIVAGGGSADGERVRLAGGDADVVADVVAPGVGREVTLTIRRLEDPSPDGLYELWFVAPDDTRPRPRRVSAGTFHPDDSGRGTCGCSPPPRRSSTRACRSRSSRATATRAAPAPRCSAPRRDVGSPAVAGWDDVRRIALGRSSCCWRRYSPTSWRS